MCECEYHPDFKDYPYPCLAQMMWGDKPEIECAACNPQAKYLVPTLCRVHYGWWQENQRMFERKFYRD